MTSKKLDAMKQAQKTAKRKPSAKPSDAAQDVMRETALGTLEENKILKTQNQRMRDALGCGVDWKAAESSRNFKLREEIDVSNYAIVTIKAENADLKLRVAQLHTDLDSAYAGGKALESQVAELKTALADTRKERDRFQVMMRSPVVPASNGVQGETVESLTQRNDALRKERDELKRRVSQLSKQVAIYESPEVLEPVSWSRTDFLPIALPNKSSHIKRTYPAPTVRKPIKF